MNNIFVRHGHISNGGRHVLPWIVQVLILFVFLSAFTDFWKRFIYVIGIPEQIIYIAIIVLPDILAILILLFQVQRFINQEKWVKTITIFFIIGCLVAWGLINNGVSATLISLKATYLYWILFYFVVHNHVVSNKSPLLIINSMRFSSNVLRMAVPMLLVTSVFYGALQVIIGIMPWEYDWLLFSGTTLSIDGITLFGEGVKAFSFFSGPIDFAIAIFYLALFSFFQTKNYWIRFLIVSIAIAGLYASGAKSVIFAILISVLLYRIFKTKSLWVVCGAVVLAYVVLVFSDIGAGFISWLWGMETTRFSLSTLAPRLEMLLSFDGASLFGNGIGAQYHKDGGLIITTVFDNSYLYIINEFGFSGFLVFLFYVYKIFKITALRGMEISAISVLVFVIAGFFTPIFQIRLPLVILIGLIMFNTSWIRVRQGLRCPHDA